MNRLQPVLLEEVDFGRTRVEKDDFRLCLGRFY